MARKRSNLNFPGALHYLASLNSQFGVERLSNLERGRALLPRS